MVCVLQILLAVLLQVLIVKTYRVIQFNLKPLYLFHSFILFLLLWDIGLAGYYVVYNVIGVVVASFLLMLIGQQIGSRVGAIIPDEYISALTGAALIVVGIMEVPYF